MIGFRKCDRCQGDVYATGDMYGDYLQCLQCGRMVDIDRKPRHTVHITKGPMKAGRPPTRRRKEHAA